MASFSYPASTPETLIIPVTPLGFTPLGKALAPTFVRPETSDSNNNKPVSPEDFGIHLEDWRLACDALTQALHTGELWLAVGILQWVPLVALAGPAWINIPAERKQRKSVYMELARVQQSIMCPRNLQLQLHANYFHRGRGGYQTNWLSISKIKGPQQPVLVFTSNHPNEDKRHFSFCQSLYQKCEAMVAPI